MVYGVAYLVSYLSQFMSLNPGDIISTGTPPGVGMGMKPPTYLKAGDVIELGIEGLGAAAAGLHRRSGLTPMVPLLDTHQHLVYPDRQRYAWTAEAPALAGRAFTLDDYRALTAGAGVAGTIFMEVDADDWRSEARMVAALAPASRAAASSGSIAACRPEDDARLRGLARRGAGARRGRLPADPARDDRRRVAVARRSAPTCGGSGRAGCRSTCASWRGSCRSRWSWRGPARTRGWCSTTAGCRTSPAGRSSRGATG